jgi:predicted metal-dependent phosphoesterase TrpH
MIKLDLHIHSQYSEDGAGTPKEIIKVLQKRGLDGMSITDHNTLKGSLKALKEAPKDFIVITGVEISTNNGHIIALNIKEEIPRNLSVEETVDRIIDLGGTPIIPHLLRSMSGIKEKNLKIIKNKISTIEVFNSCSNPQNNLKVIKIAKKYNLGGTGGSDSHSPKYVGSAYTIVDTKDLSSDSIINEIDKKKTWGSGTTMPINYRRDRMVKSIEQFFQRGFKRI